MPSVVGLGSEVIYIQEESGKNILDACQPKVTGGGGGIPKMEGYLGKIREVTKRNETKRMTGPVDLTLVKELRLQYFHNKQAKQERLKVGSTLERGGKPV